MPSRTSSPLFIPGVSSLIAFLSYSSQYLLPQLEPRAQPTTSAYIGFNVLVACLWICYYRACTTEPGPVPVPGRRSPESASADPGDDGDGDGEDDDRAAGARRARRWCRKCQAPKPHRTHHCRQCQRCIPKMDHDCVWIQNCVSLTTFPHFIRFLFYAVAAMTQLEHFLYQKSAVIWHGRHLPSYLGPTPGQLGHLFVLVVVNSLTLFALAVMLARTVWSLAVNTTTIEGWEIDRHQALLRRARILGGYAPGPGGVRMKISRQEFPYDVGLWPNCKQGMGGSGFVPGWFWPLAATPSVDDVLPYPVNGFTDPSLDWPPPDPERLPQRHRGLEPGPAFVYGEEALLSPSEQMAAFRRRQLADLERRRRGRTAEGRTDRLEMDDDRAAEEDQDDDEEDEEEDEIGSSKALPYEDPWTNREGERLTDYGVDEDTEMDGAEDLPLAELRRRRAPSHRG
ncbi:MAG: Palmitoyltransferase [Phylliscum demangeonii]|nr:MAG: Palmitoyltransferase [Phylliscum demangeonii]